MKKYLLLLLCLYHVANAAEIFVQLQNKDGSPVGDAVVYLDAPSDKKTNNNAKVIIDQINKEFVRYVTPLQVGTSVTFPNKDNIRHHVYSFSEAKKFELKLYSGVPAQPVLFDHPGIVVLGCNIHDWMLAYVLVLETPWFASTDQTGKASLTVPNGTYTLHIWHPDQEKEFAKTSINVNDALTLTYTHPVHARVMTPHNKY